MFEVVPDPAWVASPKPHATSHEAARSVDVTLALAQPAECATEPIQGYCQLDAGTGFDEFTARAHADATEGLTQEQLANRSTLRQALRRVASPSTPASGGTSTLRTRTSRVRTSTCRPTRRHRPVQTCQGKEKRPGKGVCGALGGTRTPNLLIRSRMLYPLSCHECRPDGRLL